MPTSYRWEKAPHYLLPILRALLDQGVKAGLLVVGEGPGLPLLKREAQRLGVNDSVDFLGALEHKELPEIYSRCQMTFVPIEMEEIGPYWGGSVQESLACGTPVVAFNNERPGFRKFGLLIPTRAEDAARLIAAALTDRTKMSSIRTEGPLVVRETCEWDSLIRRLDMIYGELSR